VFRELTVSPSIQTEPRLKHDVEQASKILSEAIGKSAKLVSVRWDKHKDKDNRDYVVLTLKDWAGEVADYFVPQDLSTIDVLYGRFYKLYGDLLQIRSHKELDELLATAGHGEPV